ncbi:hypothetical protein Taro_042163, partial [Colocasia esculenta]|nr:hypothetical protein [Colocasia esculenta]
MVQSKGRNMKKRSTSVDTSPGQVDTREPSQKACCSDSQSRSTPNAGSLGECVDTPHGQVDTLWNLCDLNFLLDTWHSREMLDQSWILCPRTPRVSLGYLGYKYPPIGHPSKKNLLRASRNWLLVARRVHLPAPAFVVPPEAISHLFKC